MTEKAIELLDDDRQGFFLQVESASINKRDHASDLLQPDRRDAAARPAAEGGARVPAGAFRHLVVQTADHAHTSHSCPTRSTRRASTPRCRPWKAPPLHRWYRNGKTPSGQAHTGARVPGRGDRAAGVERDGGPRPDGSLLHADRAREVLAPPRLGRLTMEARGIEPLLQPCKGRVLPLPLRPRCRPTAYGGGAAAPGVTGRRQLGEGVSSLAACAACPGRRRPGTGWCGRSRSSASACAGSAG